MEVVHLRTDSDGCSASVFDASSTVTTTVQNNCEVLILVTIMACACKLDALQRLDDMTNNIKGQRDLRKCKPRRLPFVSPESI